MFRLEVFLAVLFSGLLLSEVVEHLVRLSLKMHLLETSAGLQALLASTLFLLALLSFFCLSCLHPELQALPPLQFIEREFNIFRKKVKICWPDTWEASTTKTVLFTFDRSLREELAVSVMRAGEALHCTEVWGDDSLEVIFPARIAGDYLFLLTCSERPVRGAPWLRRVLPGAVDKANARMVALRSHTAVLPSGGSFTARLQLRDGFENHIEATEELCDKLQVIIDSEAFYEIGPTSSLPRYIQVKFSFTSQTSDAFPALLSYLGKEVARLQLLVLSQERVEAVNSYVTRMGWNSYYELQLTKLYGAAQKAKTVYVYLTDRQVCGYLLGMCLQYGLLSGDGEGILPETNPTQACYLPSGSTCHLPDPGDHNLTGATC